MRSVLFFTLGLVAGGALTGVCCVLVQDKGWVLYGPVEADLNVGKHVESKEPLGAKEALAMAMVLSYYHEPFRLYHERHYRQPPQIYIRPSLRADTDGDLLWNYTEKSRKVEDLVKIYFRDGDWHEKIEKLRENEARNSGN